MSAGSDAARGDAGWRPRAGRLAERVGIHNLSLLLALAVLLLIFGALRGDVFFSARNVLNIGLAVTILGVLAMSQTAVIVAGARIASPELFLKLDLLPQ